MKHAVGRFHGCRQNACSEGVASFAHCDGDHAVRGRTGLFDSPELSVLGNAFRRLALAGYSLFVSSITIFFLS
jgi:hypothetical protein